MLRRTFCSLSLAALVVAAPVSILPAFAQEGPQIWSYWASGAEADALAALQEVSAAQHPDTPLSSRVISGAAAEMRAALQTSFMGGNPPAVYQSTMGQELLSFVQSGRLAPIDDVWAEVDGEVNFPSGVKRVVTFDGHVYGVPLNIHLISNVFYNKKIFDELGLEAPTNAEEFQAVAKALADAGHQALGNASGAAWTLYGTYPFLYEALGHDGYLDLASGEIAFTDERVKASLERYTETYVAAFMPNWTGYTWSDTAAQFAEGNVAMYQMGDWLSAYLEDAGMVAGEDFDVFTAPGFGDAAILQMDILAQTVQTDEANALAGQNFLRTAASPEGQLAFNLQKGSVAPNQTTSTDQYGTYSQAAAAKVAEAGDNALPNLKNLLPVLLGNEFGNLIVGYAQSPSPEALDGMLNTLEQMRNQLQAEGAFYRW